MSDEIKALVEGICAVCGQLPHKHSGGYPNTCPMIATYTPKTRDELNDPWLKAYVSAQADCIETLSAALTAQADEIERLRTALKPFADCCEYISDDEDNDEWAKFRLIIKNYRDARAALKAAQEVKA